MKPSEEKIKMILEGKGYIVLNKGSPDFLCYKMNKKNHSYDIVFMVEVKSNRSLIPTPEQLQWALALNQIGVKVCHVNADDVESIEFMLKDIKNLIKG